VQGLAAGVGLFATALLFGGMVFFALIVAPNVFRALGPQHAAAFLRRLFPVYYVFGAGMAAAAVVASGFVFSRQGLMPRINAYRDAELAGDASAKQPFARLHRLSVVVNLAQMVLVALVLVGFAGRAW
jgi:uncharacterized membrane protein YhiD involved in acid resistance